MIFLKINKDKDLSDDQLILKYKTSENKKWMGILFERYSHMVYGVCLKYIQDRDDSKDAVISIFEKLLDDVLSHDISNFKSWLYMVSKNHCLMKIRKNNSDKKRVDIVNVDVYNVKETDQTGIEDNVIKEKKIETLTEALKELKDEQKVCVELFYLKQKCYNEISEETGFDLKKVKSYIQNGKRNLRLILEKNHKTLYVT